MPGGELFSSQERFTLDETIRRAEQLSRVEFSLFVGTAEGEPRPFATRLHNSLAPRHHRLAGDLHDPLHRRVARHHRHGPYAEIDPKAALASAFTSVGKGGYATLISAGAVAGLMTVVMTLMIGATRVVFAMGRDRLLPRSWRTRNPRTGTPVRITLIIGGSWSRWSRR